MRESAIEKHLKKKVKERGGLCWKFVSPGLVGVPDRVVALPGGAVLWVELKAPGKELRPTQERRRDELVALGHQHFVLDSISGADKFVDTWLPIAV